MLDAEVPPVILAKVECAACGEMTPYRQGSGRDIPLDDGVRQERAEGVREWERPWATEYAVSLRHKYGLDVR